MEFQPKGNCSVSVIENRGNMELENDKQDHMAALILCSLTYVEVDQETAQDMEKERYEAIHDHESRRTEVRQWLPPVPSITHRMGECSQVISKVLEISDVKDNQSRLALKTGYVKEEFLPMLIKGKEDVVDGIDVIAYDSYGNRYENMVFRLWGVKMYVFTRQWKQFSEKYKLISKKDSVNVWMFRDKYTKRLGAVIIPILDRTVSIADRIIIRRELNAKK